MEEHNNIQLEESYIMLCLKCFKPQFEFKYFIDGTITNFLSNFYEKDVFSHVKVFDLIEKRSKMLIIFRSKMHNRYLFFSWLMKQSIRDDIVLNLLDSYFLDSDKHFFIFEMEYCDMTLEQFIQRNGISQDSFNRLTSKIMDYFDRVHDLQYQMQKPLGQFFVNIISSNKIEVKINLIDINFQLKTYSNKYLKFEDQNPSPTSFAKLSQKENNIIQVEEKKSFLLDLRIYKVLHQFVNEMIENLNEQIQKKDLSDKIQQRFKRMKQFHPIEIFNIIQQYPVYDNFQVLKMGQNSFELSVMKRSNLIRLKAEAYSSLRDAEQRLAIYNNLILYNQSATLFLQSEIIITEERFYILSEKEYIQQFQIENNNLNSTEKNDLQFLNNLIEFCYQLLVQNDLQINYINPSNILFYTKYANQSQDQTNEANVTSFMIEDFDQSDFSSLYIQIFNRLINLFDCKENTAFIQDTNNLGEQFFQKISEKSLSDLQNVYNSIKTRINNLLSIKDCNLFPQFSSRDFNKLSVKLQNQRCKENILDLQKCNTQLKISSLVLEDGEFDNFTQQFINYKQIVSNKFNQLNPEKQQKIQQLSIIFSNYQSEAIKCYSNYLFQFLENRLADFVKIQFQVQNPKLKQIQMQNVNNTSIKQDQLNKQVNTINQEFDLSQVVNQNELSQKDINLINNLEFMILNIQLFDQAIKIIITNDNLFYLVGKGPYVAYKPWEICQIEELFQLEEELETNIKIFGHNNVNKLRQTRKFSFIEKFIYELKDLQILTIICKNQSIQFGLQGCKQIKQLNLVLSYYSRQFYYFKSIIQQIQQTDIKKIKLILIRENNIPQTLKKVDFTSFYKIKRLVSFELDNKFIHNQQYYYYQQNSNSNLDLLAWSFDIQF
ncbi:hypothetical protein ABPG72_017646 [Tetrahymena utriculariae]